MATQKNTFKHASYAFAFARINASLEDGYYLEAVTLAESIISDRLLSFVKHHKKSETVNTTFKKLIELSEKFNKIPTKTKSGSDLFDALHDWRKNRNTCVHSLSKSEPGEPTVSVDEFLKIAEKCAKDGKVLARLVCNWHRKSKSMN